MILTQRHMITTLVIAMLLHGGIAAWFSLPDPVPLPEPVKPPLRINLLAMIDEASVNAATETIQPPAPKSEKPVPVKEKPLVRKLVKPKPAVPPVTEVKPVEDAAETVSEAKPVPVAEVVQQQAPAETSPAPLDAIATARYGQLLVAWLEQHKKYPHRAKRLRIEGETILRIVIDRFGQTQHVSLAQRSGNRLLDRAALEMAQRANPFPPMPENDKRTQLEFVVPVAFLLH